VAWGLQGEVDYALEAAVFVTGAAVQWLRDGLGIISEAPRPRHSPLLESNDDVYFVPP
jgi:glycerol kinase